MTRRFFGICGALTGLTLVSGSCIDDPLADLDGAPAAVVTDHALLVQAIGERDTVIAKVVDGRFTALQVPITYTACDADVSVTATPGYDPVPPVSVSFIVQAITSGASCVVVSGGGVTDTVDVGVLPTSFSGTVSSTTPQGGDTLTINSTAELKFDTALVTATFAGAALGSVVSKTPDVIRVLVPFSNPGPVSIAGINVTYVPGLRVTLLTSASVTQTGNRWAGSSSWQTAPDISALLPAAASTSRMIVTRSPVNNVAVCPEGFGSTGPCNFFRFNVPASATYNFTIDWEGTAGAPDVDIYHCSDSTVANFGTACFVTGGSGATGAKPQSTGNDVYTATTYWFVIEIFDGAGPRNAYLSIARP
jgi:hypothetical protein